MKRVTSFLLLTVLLLSIVGVAHAETWTCPSCGRTGNTGNFCPNCGKSKPDWKCQNCGQTGNTGNFCSNCGASKNSGSSSSSYTYKKNTVAVYNCALKDRIASRTGPSTAYDEPGTFFEKNWQSKYVNVYSKAVGNDVWWLQVEINEGGRKYRVYTGLKRVDVNINSVPEETCQGTGYVNTTGSVVGYYGPGRDYQPITRQIPRGVQVTIWAYENDFLLIDFYDSNLGMQRRAWIEANLVKRY